MYSAPIVATGDGPFDVVHHTNTGDRVLGVHIAGPSAPGQFAESWVDILFVKGFDAGQPIVYISTDAGQPLSAVLERSTYVPALDKAAYNGGDDFLGSARERLFGFVNGQTGADNKEAQGFVHLVKDGHASEDASAGNTALIDALRNGGDLLNVFGDFPTETDPRHAQAYSPLWDAQLGQWTDKAIDARARQAADRRGAGLQPRRDPARPDHRPRRSALRRGRRRHQLRRDRLHRQGADGQPRRAGRRTRSSPRGSDIPQVEAAGSRPAASAHDSRLPTPMRRECSMMILAISGSLRRSSINSAVLRAAAATAARDGLAIAVDEFVRKLPHFDPDLEAEPPEAVLRFRARCEGAAGVLLAVPEYAFGIPGAFKNALDWTVGIGSLYRKPMGVLNVAPPGRGAQVREALGLVLTALDADVAYVSIPGGPQ